MKRKRRHKGLCVKLDAKMAKDIEHQAQRLERSMSYMAQWAWKLAKRELRKRPTERGEREC